MSPFKDQADQRAAKEFSREGFVKQLLIHSPPTGLHSVRHYGLYAGSKRRDLEQAATQLGGRAQQTVTVQEPETLACCSVCGENVVTVAFVGDRTCRQG